MSDSGTIQSYSLKVIPILNLVKTLEQSIAAEISKLKRQDDSLDGKEFPEIKMSSSVDFSTFHSSGKHLNLNYYKALKAEVKLFYRPSPATLAVVFDIHELMQAEHTMYQEE